jgi:hypothetical protein
VFGGLLLGYGLLQVGRWSLDGGSTGLALLTYILAVLSVAGGLATASWIAVAEHRRSVLELDLHLGPSTLELVWRRGPVVKDRDTFQLRDIGRIELREVRFQRWHVVARLLGGTDLAIPMERDSRTAAQWLADELRDAVHEARITAASVSPPGTTP